jgi:hypothetical protein
MNPKYSPAIFHLADTEFPGQIMPFGVVNRRNPRTLGNPEVINEYGVANSHLIKGIPAKWWHLHPGFRGINGESGVKHAAFLNNVLVGSAPGRYSLGLY